MGNSSKKTYKWLEAHGKMLNITNHQRNANRYYNEILLENLLGWPLFKKKKKPTQQITSAGEEVQKLEPCAQLMGR